MQAFILAAGKGTRLGELSKKHPKCLNDIGGITILEYIINQLINLKVTKIVINIHHLGEQIVDFINKKNFNVEIIFSIEESLLGVFGGLKQAIKYISEDFIVINSDIYTDFDLNKLIIKNNNSDALVTLLTNNNLSSPILFDNDYLVGIESKTGYSVIPKYFTDKQGFAGIQYLRKNFIELTKEYDSDLFLFQVYFKLIEKGFLINKINLEDKIWIDMGTLEELNRLRELFNKS